VLAMPLAVRIRRFKSPWPTAAGHRFRSVLQPDFWPLTRESEQFPGTRSHGSTCARSEALPWGLRMGGGIGRRLLKILGMWSAVDSISGRVNGGKRLGWLRIWLRCFPAGEVMRRRVNPAPIWNLVSLI
jgi:hypothetical protein